MALLEYFISEPSGTNVNDTGTANVDLTATFTGSSARTTDANGGGILWDVGAAGSTAKSANINGTALETALVGLKTITMTVMCTDTGNLDYLIAGISANGPWDLVFERLDGTDGYKIWWNDSSVWQGTELAAIVNTRSVVTIVIDTNLADGQGRLKIYVGSSLVVTSDGPPEDSTFPERANDRRVVMSNDKDVSEGRAMGGSVWYLSFHNTALTSGQVTSRNTNLVANHDADPDAAGGGVVALPGLMAGGF